MAWLRQLFETTSRKVLHTAKNPGLGIAKPVYTSAALRMTSRAVL